MALIEIKRTVELDGLLRVDALNGVAFTNENAAHKFTITCMRNGAPYSLANTSISARFMRADGTTINVTGGEVSQSSPNVASIIINKRDCYNVPGRFQLAILCTAGTSVLCIYAAVGRVIRSTDDTVLDTGTVLPDATTVAQMFEQLGDQLDESFNYGTRIAALEDDVDDLETAMDGKASTTALGDETTRAQGAELTLATNIGTVGSSVSSLSTFATDRFKTIAADFSTSTAYSVGDSVYYENKLYRFIEAHAAGAWNSSHVTQVTVGGSIKRVKAEIADVFSESTAYSPGDYCYHGDYFVRCTTAHQGAWNAAHFTSVTVADELESLNDRPAYTFADDGEGNVTIS